MLASIKDIDFEAERALHAELVEAEKKLQTTKHEASDIGHAIDDLETKSNKIEGELETLRSDICPYCEQEYKDNQAKIKEKEDTLVTFSADLTELGTLFEEAHAEVQTLSKARDDINSKITIENFDELLDIRSKSEQY